MVSVLYPVKEVTSVSVCGTRAMENTPLFFVIVPVELPSHRTVAPFNAVLEPSGSVPETTPRTSCANSEVVPQTINVVRIIYICFMFICKLVKKTGVTSPTCYTKEQHVLHSVTDE